MSIQNNLSSEEAIAAAEEAGQVVVFPALNQLQIDIDSAESYAIYQANMETFERHFRISDREEHSSKSGGDCRHITLTLEKNLRSNEERVLYRDANPTLFIEPKPEAAK